MKKILQFIRTSMSVSVGEARGILVGFVLFLGIFGLIFLADFLFSEKPQTLIISSPKMLDSLTVNLDNQAQTSYSNNYSSYPSSSNYSNSSKLFSFNPNTATVEQLQTLGLPRFIAERIEKYRSKGGKFKKKEDLAKIYGLRPETYERLEPYIMLPSVENETTQTPAALATQNTANEVKPTATFAEKPTFKKPEIQKFDLNTADTTQLKMINGIGSGFAKRIIKFREMLGGFASAEIVKETYGLPPETADELLKYGYVRGGFKKLKINELQDIRHPFLKYNQAKAIIAYRGQHGKFQSVEDLKKIQVLDEATIRKIEPYLEF